MPAKNNDRYAHGAGSGRMVVWCLVMTFSSLDAHVLVQLDTHIPWARRKMKVLRDLKLRTSSCSMGPLGRKEAPLGLSKKVASVRVYKAVRLHVQVVAGPLLLHLGLIVTDVDVSTVVHAEELNR